jgi:hypothetical protein
VEVDEDACVSDDGVCELRKNCGTTFFLLRSSRDAARFSTLSAFALLIE